jgi:hypothetical protein
MHSISYGSACSIFCTFSRIGLCGIWYGGLCTGGWSPVFMEYSTSVVHPGSSLEIRPEEHPTVSTEPLVYCWSELRGCLGKTIHRLLMLHIGLPPRTGAGADPGGVQGSRPLLFDFQYKLSRVSGWTPNIPLNPPPPFKIPGSAPVEDEIETLPHETMDNPGSSVGCEVLL